MLNLNRINQVLSFAKLAASPSDWLKLFVLGVARGHPFSSHDLISSIGSYFYSSIIFKTNILVKTTIELNPSDLGHLISFEEIFVRRCYNLHEVPFVPSHVIDCGSHIGLFSLLANEAFPCSKITAFEPNSNNFKYINKQIANNQFNSIDVLQSAVSLQDGESFFSAECSNTGSIQSAVSSSSYANGYVVKTIDICNFIRQINPSSLLLKIDIEGEELNVIPAIIPLLPEKCAIFFEVHSGEAGWNQISNSLSEANFKVKQLRSAYPYIDGFACRA
jgi:FkbM family methyltransferase